TGPVHQHRIVQPAEAGVVEVPLVDVAAFHALAVPVGGLRTELARAAPGAVAVHILCAPDRPSISHQILPGLACAGLSPLARSLAAAARTVSLTRVPSLR